MIPTTARDPRLTPVDRVLRGLPSPDRWGWWLAATLAVILGAKLFLIGALGGPTPFWDQWNAEGDRLFVPYLDGQLDLGHLLAPHNEHRIFFTRLVSLAVLEATGGWNTIAEMIVDAVIHVGLLALVAWVLRDATFRRAPGLSSLLLLLLFAVPFGIENTLWGFQSQFALLGLFSVAAIVLLVEAPGLGARWWLGATLGALSVLTMVAGALAPLAAALATIAQLAVGTRPRTGRELAASLLLLVLTAALMATAVAMPAHDALRASGPVSFLLAFSRAAGWPVRLPLLAPLLLNAPGLVLAVRTLGQRRPLGDPAWRPLALLVWAGLQSASTAYARAVTPDVSRYLDGLALAVFFNLAAFLLLRADAAAEEQDRLGRAGALWMAMIGAFLMLQAVVVYGKMAPLVGARGARTEHVAAYLRTGDRHELEGRPMLAIPFPWNELDHYTAVLARPEVRGVLPSELGLPEAARASIRQRLLFHGGLRLGATPARVIALWSGGVAAAAGLGLLLLLIVQRGDRART